MKRAFIILSFLLTLLQSVLGQDITPPVLHSIIFSSNTYNAGDTVWMEMIVTDDISGPLPSNFFVYYDREYNPGYNPTQIASIRNGWLHSSGNTYINWFIPTLQEQLDSLSISRIQLRDVAGNTLYIDTDTLPTGHPLKKGIKINTPTYTPNDVTPPTLDSIWINKDTVTIGDTMLVKVLAHDNLGGPITYYGLSFTRTGYNGVAVAPGPVSDHMDGDTMVYTMIINKYGQNASFSVKSISMRDDSNNSVTYSDQVDFVLPFIVQGRIEDFEKPALLGIDVYPSDTLQRGDSAAIYLTVRDTISGIASRYSNFLGNIPYITFSILNQYDQQYYPLWEPVEVVKDSLYKFPFIVSEFAADGPWHIINFQMVDSAYNVVNMYDQAIIDTINNFRYYVDADTLTYISGNIRTSSGAPLQNSRVYTVKFTPGDSLLISNRATYTDLNGNYQFVSEARDSNVYIKAIPNDTLYPSEIPTYWDSTWQIVNANVLIVDTNQVTVDTFATLAGTNTGGHGFVTGFIWQGAGKNSPGDPVANLPLILVNDQGQPIAFATTDATGLYRFTNVPDGTYQVYADWIGINNNLAPYINITADSDELTGMDFKVEGQQLVPLFTGVTEIGFAELGIYPNPSTGQVYIKPANGTLSGEVNISIYNIGGQQVRTTVVDSEQSTVLDLSDLSNGLYLILLTDGDQSISSRVEIQK